MSSGMSLGRERDDRSGDVSAPPVSSCANQAERESRVPLGHRDTFLARRNALIGDLSKCYDEGVTIGRIIQVLPIVSSLPEDFRFQDALSYRPNTGQDMVFPSVEELKSKISEKIRAVASKADYHCDSVDARTNYMGLLERQFNDMLSRLIDEERTTCAQKVEGLCLRLDCVCRDLALEFHGDIIEHLDKLTGMAKSLRLFSQRCLLATTDDPQSIELISSPPSGPHLILPIKEFFDRLNSVTIELLNILSDQSAA